MNRLNSTLPLALWAALSVNGPGTATAAETAHREHAAHEHGHGVLEVVAEGADLAIALRIPAVNAVGFEHAPSTEQQHRRVDEAIARFRAGEQLFVPSGAAGCKLVSADVEMAGMEGEHGEAHGHDEHEKHAHEKDEHEHENHAHDKDEHEHEKHAHDKDEHEHETDAHAEHEAESHSELHAEYRFRCADHARLEAIEVRVFDALNDVEEIEARVVTEAFQGATDLTARNTTVKLMR